MFHDPQEHPACNVMTSAIWGQAAIQMFGVGACKSAGTVIGGLLLGRPLVFTLLPFNHH